MEDKQAEIVIKKLDNITRILALIFVKDYKLQKDRIIALSTFGFSPSEISQLLGTTPNTVNVALSTERKQKGTSS
jgi:hypothetical protein